eukprot:8870403-Alexandrium_andersonii.AAC.1
MRGKGRPLLWAPERSRVLGREKWMPSLTLSVARVMSHLQVVVLSAWHTIADCAVAVQSSRAQLLLGRVRESGAEPL